MAKKNRCCFCSALTKVSLILMLGFAGLVGCKAVFPTLAQSTNMEVAKISATAIVKSVTGENTEYTDVQYNDYVFLEGTVSQAVVDSLESVLDYLPVETEQEFKNAGWQLIITASRDLNEIADESDPNVIVSGLTVFSEKRIYVRATAYDIANSALHEFGHFEDHRLGDLSESDEFVSIYQEESDDYASISDYAASSSSEYFAEVFSDICYKQDARIELVSKTATYIAAHTPAVIS